MAPAPGVISLVRAPTWFRRTTTVAIGRAGCRPSLPEGARAGRTDLRRAWHRAGSTGRPPLRGRGVRGGAVRARADTLRVGMGGCVIRRGRPLRNSRERDRDVGAGRTDLRAWM